MATKIEAVGQFLTDAELHFAMDEAKARIETGFRTEFYVNPQGDPLLPIIIVIEESGEFIVLVAPFCYCCENPEHFPAVLEACNHVARARKMVRFSLDPADGEVRAELHLPLEDAIPTQQQFLRILHVFPQVVDDLDPMFREAVEEGRFVPPESPAEMLRAFREFMRQRRKAPVAVELAE
jgi:hypothetical protein